jgi:hypothetical protein
MEAAGLEHGRATGRDRQAARAMVHHGLAAHDHRFVDFDATGDRAGRGDQFVRLGAGVGDDGVAGAVAALGGGTGPGLADLNRRAGRQHRRGQQQKGGGEEEAFHGAGSEG